MKVYTGILLIIILFSSFAWSTNSQYTKAVEALEQTKEKKVGEENDSEKTNQQENLEESNNVDYLAETIVDQPTDVARAGVPVKETSGLISFEQKPAGIEVKEEE